VYVVVVKKFTFAISSADEFLVTDSVTLISSYMNECLAAELKSSQHMQEDLLSVAVV